LRKPLGGPVVRRGFRPEATSAKAMKSPLCNPRVAQVFARMAPWLQTSAPPPMTALMLRRNKIGTNTVLCVTVR